MSRFPGSPAGQVIKPSPDVYTVLLLVAALMMLWAGISAFMALTGDFQLTFGQIFSGGSLPQ